MKWRNSKERESLSSTKPSDDKGEHVSPADTLADTTQAEVNNNYKTVSSTTAEFPLLMQDTVSDTENDLDSSKDYLQID